MTPPSKVVHFKMSNIFIAMFATFFLIVSFWLLFIGITCTGCPFPEVAIEKFFDLGFFSFSMFSFIIFLTMIPFQTTEGKLSPGFYARILRNPWSHFGLYLLITCSVICFLIIAFHPENPQEWFLSEFYMALLSSIVTAILLHRVWVLRYLHEPYIVYTNIDTLMNEEPREVVWEEILECTFKAIGDKRISDSKNFINLLAKLYNTTLDGDKRAVFEEDIHNLYDTNGHLRILSRYMEIKWPFLIEAKG